jgi:CBS domain-containing protein
MEKMTQSNWEPPTSPLARDIMTDSVVAASRTTTMRDLAIQMLLGGFSGVPITERDGTILGLVTEFDIIRGIQAGRSAATTVAEAIMTRDVLTVTPETPLEEVADILERERFVRVPVAERGKLIGIVSRSDVLRYLVEPNFMTFPS